MMELGVKKQRLLGIMLCAALPSMAFSSSAGWHYKPGAADPNHQFHRRLPATFEPDITPDQDVAHIKLTKAQRHQALVWGLSEAQEQRYVALMQNKSGHYYDPHSMTPVEVLGANARTDAERVIYATMAAHDEFQHLGKYLAFLAAYHDAAVTYQKQLNLPVVLPFNVEKYSPYNYQPVNLHENDKLLLLTSPNEEVRPIVSSLMARIGKDHSIVLNVYFMGQNISDSAIQNWARHQNIPPEMVRSGNITLNHENPQLASMTQNRRLPLLVLIRNNKSQFVDTGRF